MIDDRLSTLADALKPMDQQALTLFLPKPAIEVGGEKWRILKKNALSALESAPGPHAPAKDFLENLDISDIKGGGIAAFTDGDELVTACFERRPIATFIPAATPFALPLIEDLAEHASAWIVAIDRHQAKLYFYSGQTLEDMTRQLDAPGYDEVATRRGIQNDIFFHRTGGDRSKFHALGTSVEEEREKTDEAYFREVAQGVLQALPMQVSDIIVMGGPQSAGHLSALLESEGLNTTIQVGSGEALDEPTILEVARNSTSQDQKPIRANHMTAIDELAMAARNGRIETLLISQSLSGLEDISGRGRASEHVRLRGIEEIKDAYRANAIALNAISTGAGIKFVGDDVLDHDRMVGGTMRWDRPGSNETA